MLVSLIILWIVAVILALFTLVIGQAYLKLYQVVRDLKAEMRGRFEKVVGNDIPSFSATTIDGKEHFTERDLIGHPTLLVFLSPTCTHCHRVMEQLIAEESGWRETGGMLLGVSTGDSEQMKKFAHKNGANFSILAQEQWELSQLFLVNATPWGIAIAPSGVVTASGVLGTNEQLHALMDAARSLTPVY
jgi:peroxiredoxin